MLEELELLVKFILGKYDEVLIEWKQSNGTKLINQKKTCVKDITKNDDLFNTILNYRSFLNDKNLELKMAFDTLNLNNEINTRVKSQNSIEYKINNYMTFKHEFGKIPMNKCVNDLYGIRIIFNEAINHKIVKEFLDTKYVGSLKCIDSSKEEGYATHVYFKKDNYSFLWELQIWDKFHEKSNIELHGQYKQEYTKWEKENRGVNHFDNTLYNNE